MIIQFVPKTIAMQTYSLITIIFIALMIISGAVYQTQLFFALLAAWLGLLTVLRRTFRVIEKSHHDFATQITQQGTAVSLERLPELQILQSAVTSLKESLKSYGNTCPTLIENFPEPFFRFDPDCRLLYCNPEANRRAGNKLPLGKKASEFDFIPYQFRKVLEESVHTVLTTGANLCNEHIMPLSLTGKGKRYIRMMWIPEKNEEGIVETVLSTYQDITELKQANERFLKSFNLNPNIMMLISLNDKTFLDVNDAFIKATGLQRKEIIGRSVAELNVLADAKQYREVRNLVYNQERIWNYEVEYYCGETLRTGLLSTERIVIDGKTCILTVTTDITEKKQFDAELARLENLNLVGEMAASIGHEVRNPITTVRGYLQMFHRNPAFSSYAKQIETMIEEVDRANAIISEFLSLAKNKIADKRLGNLNQVINSLFPLLEADAFCLGHQLNYKPSPVPDILFDDKEIRQLILNLVRNAIEAMDLPGKVTIKTYSAADSVVLEISDTGKGIPRELIHRLGTPFFTTKENGTGLGLAVCYRIAQRHNAAIEVDSSPAGTTFYITFTNLQDKIQSDSKSTSFA